MIANHGNIFEQHLYEHYEQWFWDLLSWARSNNMDDLRAGMKAVFKFLDVICGFIHSIPENTDEDSNSAVREKVINVCLHSSFGVQFFISSSNTG